MTCRTCGSRRSKRWYLGRCAACHLGGIRRAHLARIGIPVGSVCGCGRVRESMREKFFTHPDGGYRCRPCYERAYHDRPHWSRRPCPGCQRPMRSPIHDRCRRCRKPNYHAAIRERRILAQLDGGMFTDWRGLRSGLRRLRPGDAAEHHALLAVSTLLGKLEAGEWIIHKPPPGRPAKARA